jgi:hypothetical protein
MHLEIKTVLAVDRRRRCPCGAVAERPGKFCRKCQARMAWRRRYDATNRRTARRIVRRQARDSARLLAGALALLAITDEGVEG